MEGLSCFGWKQKPLAFLLGILVYFAGFDLDCSSSPPPSPVGYQVVASPSEIQEMEKPMESDYEVFLSFRGPDTRLDIADYLYNSLIRAAIRAYRDNDELHIGEEIGPELVQAIKQSEISIPILSKGYAASPWCLMELVQMVECKENWGRKIMPIFYDVAPSEVRYQTGSYGKAITLHKNKQRFTKETIEKWKTALSEVGALRGWELNGRGKGEFTEEVVQMLLIELKKNNLAEPDYLVEMDDHVDRIMEKIGEQTSGTKIVGIHGMGGVGKTTLATIIYNKLSADFDNCCFLSDVRETKIVILQNQLISRVLRMEWPSINGINEGKNEIRKRLSSKKVLLLLDDVDQNTQLEALVGMGECWFDRGSKVIITTRNEEVLIDVDLKHELTGMDFNHSLLLFSKHAFKRDHPPAEYVSLSEKAVKICGHLPLALEIIGSFLAGKDTKSWVATLERLKTIPNTEVKSKLKISFEALEPQEKEIFLDVCCFFVGSDVRIVTYMWASCKLFPEYSLEVLKRKSLMKIVEGNQLWVHDQLRDLGRDIVHERANFKPKKQSRVWDHEEAIDVLERKEGRENVEAISLKFDHQFQDFLEMEEFVSLSNLRFLKVDCVNSDENNIQHFPSTYCFQRNPIMLPNLRWLSWPNFPVFFKLTARSFKKLVILDLSRSEITDEWEGWNHLKMAKNLKVLNLTGCRNLRRTPDLSAYEKLGQLILEGCTELVQVDRSIGRLKHLESLNLRGCGKLKTLPDEVGELEALTELRVDGTSIKQSKISIPIFSKGYAESEWCLMELVQMVECKEKWGQEIMPIFYDIKPSEVRDQIATYGEAIHVNKQLYTDETIQNWKAALNKVGKLKGWELKERGKSEFTEEIVQKLLIEFKKNYLAVTNWLVEMDDQVDQIMEKIGEQTTGTKIVGIYGMSGVGKTTLATIVYNKLSADFDNHCFLSNIRETKIETLQNQLISEVLRKEWPSINSINEGITVIKNRLSSKKVILLLDDVDHKTQLDALVGVGERWFGQGSKVIITTRNEEVLKDVDLKHELTEMDFDHALQLFSRHAFRREKL